MLKKLLFLGCGVLLFCGMISKSVAQSISTVLVTNTSGALPAGGYCAGQQIRVAFTASGFAGTPTFSIQLSDATGIFTTPTVIGSGTSSPITATVPVGTSAGTGYKVRVVSGATTSAGSTAFQVNPVATVNPITSINPCSGTVVGGIAFSSSSAGAAFSWTSSANVGFGTSGTGNIPSFTASNGGTTATVTVTPSVNGCTGVPTTFTVSVRPISSVNSISNVNLCNGSTGAAINFNSTPAGATFSWTSSANVGFGTAGTGNIPAYTATNATSSPIVATVTVTPTASGCTGTPRTFTITVFPTNVTVNPVTSVSYCDDASGAAINFSSSTAGTTFDWVSNLNVGFGTSGSGNIPAFTANNNGTTDAVATVTVIPKAGGCPGVPTTFTVTVRHRATVNSVSNASLCNGASAPAISFSSSSAGATFNWTSSANIGFGLSGTGNIPAYTATNNGTSTITATITVTPNVSGCTGNSTTFTITVNPTATVNTISNASFCGGIPIAGTTLSSPTAGTTFSWTSSANVGFGTSGSGNIPAYTTISTNTTQVISIITVTPSLGGCPGTPKTFTITVNPTPTINSSSNAVYCNNTPAASIAFSSAVTGTTFSWTSSLNVGFGLSGTGNIPAYTATNATSNPLVSTINVTPTTGICTGAATSFTVTVNPTPIVGTIANATYCGNTNATAIAFSSTTTNTTYAWTSSSNVGFGTSGTGNINAYTTLDNDSEVIGTVTVTPTANTCVGAPKTFTLTVNPSPKVNSVANAVFCNATSAPAISFSSPTTGVTFNWSTPTNVGFGTTGVGNIATYTATNGGSGIVISTINVAAKTATCTGPTRAFTITVNPTPTITPISNTTYCGTASGTPINFSSPVSGTTFAWTSTANIGFGTSGNGNIAGYTVTNPISSATTATVTINPTANGCAGTTSTFTITVNPTPAVNPVSNVTLCAGASGAPINFSSDTPNTNFNWSTSTNVGFGIAGSGNIAGGFSALNNSQNVITTTVSTIPATATCTGNARLFTFVVNPTPGNPDAPSPVIYCATAIAQPLISNGGNLKWYNEANGGMGSNLAPTPSTNNSTDNSLTTSYYVSQTNQYNCESQRSQIQVTIKPLPPFPNVSKQEYLLCQFDPAVQLDAKLQGTGQSLLWFLPNNTESEVTPTITTDTGFQGTFTVLQVRDGCRGPRSEIKINVRTTPIPTVSQFPIVSCQNAAPQPLEATGTNLKWYNTNKTGGTPQTTPNIPPTQTPGNYQFYVTQTGTNGCESPRAEITVIIQPLPSATLSGGSTITQGQSAPLTVLFTGQGPWTYTLSNGLTLTTTQNPANITVSPLETTVFTVTKITNSCGEGIPAGSATINVRVATIDVGNPNVTSICAGQAFSMPFFSSDFFPSNTQFRVQISKTMDDASFQSIPTEGSNSPLSATVPGGASGGSYYVRVVGVASNFTIKGQVSPVQITVRELPTATISGPTSIYENESAKLSIAFTGENPWRITYRDSLSQKDTTFNTSVSPYEFSVRPAKTNTYRIVSISNACGNGSATSRLVLVVNPILSVSPNSGTEWIKIYPTPVQTRCTIEIEASGNGNKPASFILTDGFGRVLLRQQTSSSKDEIDFSHLNPGVYFLNAEQNGRLARRKILKIQ
jgi:Ig-like domain CHU_C associated/Secretion system C-terminal sorting domain/PKD-like domain